MADDNKKPDDVKADPKPQDTTEPAKQEPKDEPKPPEKIQDKPVDKKQDDDKGAEPKENPKDNEPKDKAEPVKQSTEDQLKAENLMLKAQLEAHKLGFNADCIEDAVVLAKNIAKRDGSDITTALQAVAKKYPDWKQQAKDKASHNGGFKIGSDGGGTTTTSEDKLNNAFGIKAKG